MRHTVQCTPPTYTTLRPEVPHPPPLRFISPSQFAYILLWEVILLQIEKKHHRDSTRVNKYKEYFKKINKKMLVKRWREHMKIRGLPEIYSLPILATNPKLKKLTSKLNSLLTIPRVPRFSKTKITVIIPRSGKEAERDHEDGPKQMTDYTELFRQLFSTLILQSANALADAYPDADFSEPVKLLFTKPFEFYGYVGLRGGEMSLVERLKSNSTAAFLLRFERELWEWMRTTLPEGVSIIVYRSQSAEEEEQDFMAKFLHYLEDTPQPALTQPSTTEHPQHPQQGEEEDQQPPSPYNEHTPAPPHTVAGSPAAEEEPKLSLVWSAGLDENQELHSPPTDSNNEAPYDDDEMCPTTESSLSLHC